MLEIILEILGWALAIYMLIGVVVFVLSGIAANLSILGFHKFDKFGAMFASGDDDDDSCGGYIM